MTVMFHLQVSRTGFTGWKGSTVIAQGSSSADFLKFVNSVLETLDPKSPKLKFEEKK